MYKPRIARPDDIEDIKKLWIDRFGEEEGFADFMFSSRYIPEYSACIEENGKIISALQSIPQNILIRGRILPCTILAGVSTDEEYTGRGLMSRVFSFYMNHIASLDIPLTVHTPANHPTFFSKGHLSATNTRFVTINSAVGYTEPENIRPDELYKFYSTVCTKYSGIISRSYPDFLFKLKDYESTGGKYIAVRINGMVTGYAVYFDYDEVLAEEVLAIDSESYEKLVDMLKTISNGRKLSMKLPPDIGIEIVADSDETKPKGVAGIASLETLLRMAVGIDDFAVEVQDRIVEQNNGVFNLSGGKTTKSPQICLSVGHLMQLIEGYKSIEELREEGVVHIRDDNAMRELSKLFPKQNCFIFDEY